MRSALILALLLPGLCLAQGTVLDDDVEIEGHLVGLSLHPREGGVLNRLQLLATGTNLAGAEGVLQEGFGIGSRYVPNRRLNERMEIIQDAGNRPVIRYTYDCDGPNIAGLSVTRRMEFDPNEASVLVMWTVENKGTDRQWVSPWVRNDVAPGGAFDAGDRIDLPTLEGIIQPETNGYHPASRNWYAVTDAKAQETFYAVFHADHTHAFLVWPRNPDGTVPEAAQLHTAFVPRILEPGQSWQTAYRINVARGLSHVDFATDELALQLQYENGELAILMSAVKAMPDLQIKARVLAPNGRVWELPTKKFSIDPRRLVRATYDWEPPGPGRYEFLAQIMKDGRALPLGADTGTPHGGIDTQFTVGNAPTRGMEAWTDAPYALDKGSRTLDRQLVANGDLQIWCENALEKIFPEDQVRGGGTDRNWRLVMARNERESFQVAFRGNGKAPVTGIRVTPEDLIRTDGAGRIPATDISVYNQRFLDIQIPSHYEGPTGRWPDALPPHEAFSVEPDQTAPVWLTVRTTADTAPGTYRGTVLLTASDRDPVELTLEVEVLDFGLPKTPLLKTDFGVRLQNSDQADAYLQNAAAHRVTLRGLPDYTFPRETSNYEGALRAFDATWQTLEEAGTTSVAVPPTLLEFPDQLRAANTYVKENLLGRAYVPLSYEPEPPAWTRLMDTITQWQDLAPDIDIAVPTRGLRPFIPPVLDRWTVHAQIFDTTNNKVVLDRIGEGGEVWWYVDHTPPRPYGNLFVDFAAIEHRILFWQAWALGVRGLHHWSVNALPDDQDPYESLLNTTPVNGDGFLLYPGPRGPVNSLRWEVIRDGIEDYDYLAIFNDLRRRLLAEPGHEALLQRAARVYNLETLVPDLVRYTRDPDVLYAKREALGRMIEEMIAALR
jgi:hypothetical protein